FFSGDCKRVRWSALWHLSKKVALSTVGNANGSRIMVVRSCFDLAKDASVPKAHVESTTTGLFDSWFRRGAGTARGSANPLHWHGLKRRHHLCPHPTNADDTT
ncbi:hypothetical protein BC936DRAFT_150075, partial [Jimgerdemannia flammicorona]